MYETPHPQESNEKSTRKPAQEESTSTVSTNVTSKALSNHYPKITSNDSAAYQALPDKGIEEDHLLILGIKRDYFAQLRLNLLLDLIDWISCE
jgi:hypothetical protein